MLHTSIRQEWVIWIINMPCDLICINLACWTWFIYLLTSLPLLWNPSLLKSTLLLFLSSMRDIPIVKFKLGWAWERVLLAGLVGRWRGIRKIILVAVLPSFPLVINSQLSIKSGLGSLTMLFKPPNSYIPPYPTLLLLRLLGMYWRKLGLGQQQRRKSLCSRGLIISNV